MTSVLRKLTAFYKAYPAAFWMTGVFLASLVLVNPSTRGDGFYYYAHARSILFDGDLDYANELAYADPKTLAYVGDDLDVLPNGMTYNKHPVGSALLWLVHLVPVRLALLILGRLGLPVDETGFGAPYLATVGVSTAVYSFAGIVLLNAMLSRYFGRFAAAAATFAVWFAASLVAYMYFHPTMSHGCSFFAAALFFFTWDATRRERDWRQAVALGLAGGVMVMVRTQNAVFFVVPALGVLIAAARAIVRKGPGARRALSSGLVTFCAAAVAFAPQLIVWKILFGSFFHTGYEAFTNWQAPRVLDVLFSTNHGLFLWAPALLLGAFGLAASARRHAGWVFPCALAVALQVYVVASWGAWHQASSFGGRMFISSYPVFAFGLAALFGRAGTGFLRFAVTFVLGALILWNLNLLFQFGTGMIPREGPVGPRLVAENTLGVPSRAVDFARVYLFERREYSEYFFVAE